MLPLSEAASGVRTLAASLFWVPVRERADPCTGYNPGSSRRAVPMRGRRERGNKLSTQEDSDDL
jgi:hypothetical protein